MVERLKDREDVTTTSGKPIDGKTTELKENGQQNDYVILTEEERGKGFIRPVRTSYKHVGVRPKYPLRDLTPEQLEQFGDLDYIKYEEYPKGESTIGRYWTQKKLESGCGTVTTMSLALAETYARDPKFYGGTFCTGCGEHIKVAEFVWDGTDEVVGS